MIYAAGVREVSIRQQVWILEGKMELIFGDQNHYLEPGDCLAMEENQNIIYQNTSALPARYIIVINTAVL